MALNAYDTRSLLSKWNIMLNTFTRISLLKRPFLRSKGSQEQPPYRKFGHDCVVTAQSMSPNMSPDAGNDVQSRDSVHKIPYLSSSHDHSVGHSKCPVKSLSNPLPSFLFCRRGGLELPKMLFTQVTTNFFSSAASLLLAPSAPFCSFQVQFVSRVFRPQF